MMPASVAHHHPMFRVRGYCPACGSASLFLGDGGFVTCSWITCAQPDAVSTLLEDKETGHIVRRTAEDPESCTSTLTVRHPLRERIGDAIMTCPFFDDLYTHEPPEEPGTYRVRPGEEELGAWSWERLT